MKLKTLVVSLAICVAIVALAATFASSAPDGLEWVGAQLGLESRAHKDIYIKAPMVDYVVPKISSPFWTMLVAGVAGVLVTFYLTDMVFKRTEKFKKRRERRCIRDIFFWIFCKF